MKKIVLVICILLGKRIADDTIDTFNGSNLNTTRNATLSVIHTKNLQERLVPEMAQHET